MRDFLSGAISMGFLVSGLFFLRFWSRTRDPLFAAFAAAFAMLASNQLLLTVIRAPLLAFSSAWNLSAQAMTLSRFIWRGGATSRSKNAAIFGHIEDHRNMSPLVMLYAWFLLSASVAAQTVALASRSASVISIRLV